MIYIICILFFILLPIIFNWFVTRNKIEHYFNKMLYLNKKIDNLFATEFIKNVNNGNSDKFDTHFLSTIKSKINILHFNHITNNIFKTENSIKYIAAFSKSGDLEFSYISSNCYNIIGYTENEIVGKNLIHNLINKNDIVMLHKKLNTAQDNECFNICYQILKRDGNKINIIDTIFIEYDYFSNSKKIIGCMFDVSQIAYIENSLIQFDKLAGIGRVSADIIHDLRQPLNNIGLVTDILRIKNDKNKIDSEFISQHVNKISAQIDRCSKIIAQLCQYNRISSDICGLVILSEFADSIRHMMESQLHIDGISIITSRNAPDNAVYVPVTRLEQAVINLILNAKDAINERRSRGDPSPGMIGIVIEGHHDHVLVHIDDNGTGIPQGAIDKMFEPFFTTKPPTQGTGLGLSIAHGMIEEMGGTLSAENIPNGARFTIKLPLASPDEA